MPVDLATLDAMLELLGIRANDKEKEVQRAS